MFSQVVLVSKSFIVWDFYVVNVVNLGVRYLANDLVYRYVFFSAKFTAAYNIIQINLSHGASEA